MKACVRLSACLFSFALLISNQAGASDKSEASTVTIPLHEYLELIKPKEVTSLTTIESAVLSGVYGEKLKLSVSGTSTGIAQPEPFLVAGPQFMISKCSGSAQLVNKDRMISVLAKDKKFQVDCDLAVRSWGELNFKFEDVLFVGAQIQGSETTVEGGNVVMRRKMQELTGTAGEVTVVGRYQVSVLPESSQFAYYFEVHNPNRSKKNYTLSLVNQESITQIQTAAEYKELEKSQISLNLNPGTNIVRVTGALGKNQWRAPVKSSMQFLMIQNHPMLQLKITTAAKRVSNEESRMPASFSSSRTYLLDEKSDFSWDSKKLEVLSSIGYSIGQANYQIYVPDQGPGLIEAHFLVDNSGTPELPFAIPGQPVYLEIDSRPQVLAQDTEGRLLTQIPNGNHHVMIQYKTEKPFGGWFGNIQETMVRPDTTMSNVSVQIGLAKSWAGVFGKSLNDSFHRFSWNQFFTALLSVLVSLFFLRHMGLGKPAKFVFLLSVFCLHLLKPALLYGFGITVLVFAFFHYRSHFLKAFENKSRWQKLGYSALAVFAFVAIFNLDFLSPSTISTLAMMEETADMRQAAVTAYVPPPPPMAAQDYSAAKGSAYGGGAKAVKRGGMLSAFGGGGVRKSMADAAMAEGMAAPEMDLASAPPSEEESFAMEDRPNLEDFKGLPSKIRIPAAVSSFGFSQGLLDEKAEAQVRFVMISPQFFNFFFGLSLCLLVFVVYRERKKFLSYLKG